MSVPRAARSIARVSPTQDNEHILVAIVVQIGKSDRMALLQMSKAPGGGDVLKKFTIGIAKHSVGHDRAKARLTGAKVEI